ncbi:MAG TPA: TfuA-like protein [Polyangiaceae bacterium]
MTVVIFCGPTISRETVLRLLDADVRPPAGRGDVLRATMDKPSAIGIVDGYFDGVPSVWHKEILWAMSQGIHVFGAASMGAIRAAELECFGMVGIGDVFEQFRTGSLSDDDEVAIAHATAEFGYRSSSDAMVNMRATFRAAQDLGVISVDTMSALVAAAKRMSYVERGYQAVLRDVGTNVHNDELEALRRWLPGSRIDQKQRDAMAMIESMAECARRGWQPKTVDFVFAHTNAWSALTRMTWAERSADKGVGALSGNDVIEELLVTGGAEAAFEAALARSMSLELARQGCIEVDPRAVESVAEEFRRERGLLQPEEFSTWLETQGLSEGELASFFCKEATARRMKELVEVDLVASVLDQVRATGAYGRLAARARAKRTALESRGVRAGELSDVGLTEAELWRWYFCDHLGGSEPSDLNAYARANKTHLAALRCAIVRERFFLTSSGEF